MDNDLQATSELRVASGGAARSPVERSCSLLDACDAERGGGSAAEAEAEAEGAGAGAAGAVAGAAVAAGEVEEALDARRSTIEEALASWRAPESGSGGAAERGVARVLERSREGAGAVEEGEKAEEGVEGVERRRQRLWAREHEAARLQRLQRLHLQREMGEIHLEIPPGASGPNLVGYGREPGSPTIDGEGGEGGEECGEGGEGGEQVSRQIERELRSGLEGEYGEYADEYADEYAEYGEFADDASYVPGVAQYVGDDAVDADDDRMSGDEAFGGSTAPRGAAAHPRSPSALIIAVAENDAAEAERLLSRGADPVRPHGV